MNDSLNQRSPRSSHDLFRLRQLIEENRFVDLHTHSRHSDGDWTPEGLIADARRVGLSLIALTDHDTVAGQDAARSAAGGDLLFLTGAEVSLRVGERLYHVLCYDFDPSSPTWKRFANRRTDLFQGYYRRLIELVAERGYPINADQVTGPDGRLFTNPVEAALVAIGAASSVDAAQQLVRGLGLRRPIELRYMDVESFGNLIEPDEMVCSVAHPARQEAGVSDRLTEADLERIRRTIPLVALEAVHPYHRPLEVEEYAALAAKHSLAVTTGSDAHGERYRRPLRLHEAARCREFLALVETRWAAHAAELSVA